MLELPLDLARRGVDGAHGSPERLGIIVGEIGAAVERVARIIRLWRRAKDIALLARGDVEKLGLRIVGRRKPIRCPERAWTDGHTSQRWGSLLAFDRHAVCIF